MEFLKGSGTVVGRDSRRTTSVRFNPPATVQYLTMVAIITRIPLAAEENHTPAIRVSNEPEGQSSRPFVAGFRTHRGPQGLPAVRGRVESRPPAQGGRLPGHCPNRSAPNCKRELEAIEAEYRQKAKKPTLDAFIQTLADSGLMTRAEVQTFLTALPADKRPTDAETLAREMFKQGKLTRFQAQAVFQGKTRGLVVGNYVVLDKLGQGGMGQVYKARHRKMDRIVAIKMLPSSATKSARGGQAVSAGGRSGCQALAPEHRHGLRRRRGQRRELPGDGTRGWPGPGGAGEGPGAAAAGPGGGLHRPGGQGAGIRPSPGRGPSRHQAREPAAGQEAAR